MSGMTFSP